MVIEQKYFTSFDGTKIGYQVCGKGKKTVLLCNGLGGNASAWKPFYNQFGNRYKFITWDYRGLFTSGPPSDISRLRIADHIEDMNFLVKKEKVTQALVVGWSMGVQVCLEYYREHAHLYTGMVLLNGTYGYPFNTALNNPLSKYILPTLNDLAKKIMPQVQPTMAPIAQKVIDWKGFINIISKLGLVHKNINQEILREVANAMVACDFKIYHEIMTHLAKHNAEDLLGTIKVPTLIFAGDEDVITPVKTAQNMASQIPNAELLIIPHGTHYSILEFPEIINLRLAKFLEENY